MNQVAKTTCKLHDQSVKHNIKYEAKMPIKTENM